jgi:hypothetical protein
VADKWKNEVTCKRKAKPSLFICSPHIIFPSINFPPTRLADYARKYSPQKAQQQEGASRKRTFVKQSPKFWSFRTGRHGRDHLRRPIRTCAMQTNTEKGLDWHKTYLKDLHSVHQFATVARKLCRWNPRTKFSRHSPTQCLPCANAQSYCSALRNSVPSHPLAHDVFTLRGKTSCTLSLPRGSRPFVSIYNSECAGTAEGATVEAQNRWENPPVHLLATLVSSRGTCVSVKSWHQVLLGRSFHPLLCSELILPFHHLHIADLIYYHYNCTFIGTVSTYFHINTIKWELFPYSVFRHLPFCIQCSLHHISIIRAHIRIAWHWQHK